MLVPTSTYTEVSSSTLGLYKLIFCTKQNKNIGVLCEVTMTMMKAR